MRPHLKSMLRQVAVFKKHESFWLVSRVPEAIFLLLVLVLLMAWLSHPLIEDLLSLVAKENPFLRMVENHKPGYTWHFAKTTELTCRVSSYDVQEASD